MSDKRDVPKEALMIAKELFPEEIEIVNKNSVVLIVQRMERLLISLVNYEQVDSLALMRAIEEVKDGQDALFPALTKQQIDILKPTWIGDEYQLYLNDNVDRYDLEIPFGYTLVKLTEADIPKIASHQTVPYPPNYLPKLFQRLPDMQFGVRHGGELVSWACTHSDLSTGLISTINSHQRKGLAKICVLKVLMQQKTLMETSFAFVKHDNISSRKLMLSCGFSKADGEYFWCSK